MVSDEFARIGAPATVQPPPQGAAQAQPQMAARATPTVPPAAAAVPPTVSPTPGAISVPAQPPIVPEVSAPGVGQQVGRQIGLTARAGAEGVAGLLGTFTDPVSAIINQFVPAERRLQTLQSVVSRLLTEAGVPQPANEVERIVQQATGGMAQAATGVGVARQAANLVTAPVARTVATQLSTMPAAQIAAGGGGGAAQQATVEAGGGPVAQTLAALGGSVAAGGAVNPRALVMTVKPPPPTSLERAAGQTGVRLMRSDISPPETGITRGIQRAGEAVPGVGTTQPRLAQQRERVQAVTDLYRLYSGPEAGPGVTQSLPEQLVADLVGKRSSDINKYKNMKDEVFTRLSGAGEVPLSNTTTILDQQIARLRNLQARGFDDEIKSVQDQIDSLRASRLELPKGYKQEQIAVLRQELSGLKEQAKRGQIYEPAIKILEDWKAALPGKNIQQIEELRKTLGDQFSTPDLLNIRTISEKAVSSIYKGLRDDMSEFIKTNGDRRDLTKWQVANNRLKNLSDDLDMDIFKRTLNKGDTTPEIVENMLFSKRPSEIKQLYDGLSVMGKSIARSAIISRAVRESQVAGPGGRTDLDPSKFADQVKELGDSINVFFSGDDLNRIQGLAKVLNATRRAGEVSARAAEEPSIAKMAGSAATVTGVAGLPLAGLYGLFGGGILGTTATAMGAGALGASARLYESPAVRDILRKLASAKPSEELALITKLSAIKAPMSEKESKE